MSWFRYASPSRPASFTTTNSSAAPTPSTSFSSAPTSSTSSSSAPTSAPTTFSPTSSAAITSVKILNSITSWFRYSSPSRSASFTTTNSSTAPTPSTSFFSAPTSSTSSSLSSAPTSAPTTFSPTSSAAITSVKILNSITSWFRYSSPSRPASFNTTNSSSSSASFTTAYSSSSSTPNPTPTAIFPSSSPTATTASSPVGNLRWFTPSASPPALPTTTPTPPPHQFGGLSAITKLFQFPTASRRTGIIMLKCCDPQLLARSPPSRPSENKAKLSYGVLVVVLIVMCTLQSILAFLNATHDKGLRAVKIITFINWLLALVCFVLTILLVLVAAVRKSVPIKVGFDDYLIITSTLITLVIKTVFMAIILLHCRSYPCRFTYFNSIDLSKVAVVFDLITLLCHVYNQKLEGPTDCVEV